MPFVAIKVDGLAKRFVAAAFGTGLLIALATSGGIVGERISGGSRALALVANTLATAAAIAALVMTAKSTHARSFQWRVLGLQGIGAAFGIAIIHFALHEGAFGIVPWLCETPAQWMNDAVAASALLAVVWACAGEGFDARAIAVAVGLLVAYGATSCMWHVDHRPHGFQSTVQQLVVVEVLAAALGVFAFRMFFREEG